MRKQPIVTDQALIDLLGKPQTARPHLAHMIGKAAVALVAFHLARRGFNCLATTDSCGVGDLWVQMNGTIQAIEVKGATQNLWQLRRSQLDAVPLFGFANVGDGITWLVSTPRLREFCNLNELKDRAAISTIQVKTLGGIRLDLGFRTIAPFPSERPDAFGQTRVVRKTLSDGTLKEYRYPRWTRRLHS